MSVPVPNSDDLRRMLSMMYSGLTVTEGSPVPIEDGKCVVAIYLRDDDTPIGAAVTDFPFAAYSGAALTRIPPGGAEDAAQSGDLSESILENVHEVFNICSRLLMSNDSPHLRLGPVYTSLADVPENEAAILHNPVSRSDLEVDVPNYGSGMISFIGGA